MLDQSNEFILIVGVGRSGTSLVQSMLNAHPDVCFPPETHFFRKYLRSRKAYSILKNKGLDDLKIVLNKDPYLKRLGLNLGQLFASIKSNGSEVPRQIYLELLQAYAKSKGKARIGDKDPRMLEYLYELYKIFPQTKVIHIIRDPRDVIASRMRADWSRKRIFLHHVITYAIQMRKGLADGTRYFGDNYHQIFYEHLISHPEQELKKLCKFINIEFHSQMINFQNSAKELITSEEMQWKRELLQPLKHENTLKWHSVLSQFQVAVIERVCDCAFTKLGYLKSGAFSQLPQYLQVCISILTIATSAIEHAYLFYRRVRRPSYDALNADI